MLRKEIGIRFKKLRIGHKMDQKGLGNAINVNGAYISSIERGEILPRLETLISAGDFLGVSVDYLLTGRTSVNKNLLPENASGETAAHFSFYLKEALASRVIDWRLLGDLILWIDKFSDGATHEFTEESSIKSCRDSEIKAISETL